MYLLTKLLDCREKTAPTISHKGGLFSTTHKRHKKQGAGGISSPASSCPYKPVRALLMGFSSWVVISSYQLVKCALRPCMGKGASDLQPPPLGDMGISGGGGLAYRVPKTQKRVFSTSGEKAAPALFQGRVQYTPLLFRPQSRSKARSPFRRKGILFSS